MLTLLKFVIKNQLEKKIQETLSQNVVCEKIIGMDPENFN